jgi:hypothetical protein
MITLSKEENLYVVKVKTSVAGQIVYEYFEFKNKKEAMKEITKQKRKHGIQS